MLNQLLDIIIARPLDSLFFMLFAVVSLVETIVLFLFKFNNFWKCLLDSFVANLVSLLAGYFIVIWAGDIRFYEDIGVSQILIGFLLSFLLEWLAVKMLNRQKNYKVTWLPVLVMNLVSYSGLAILNFI